MTSKTTPKTPNKKATSQSVSTKQWTEEFIRKHIKALKSLSKK